MGLVWILWSWVWPCPEVLHLRKTKDDWPNERNELMDHELVLHYALHPASGEPWAKSLSCHSLQWVSGYYEHPRALNICCLCVCHSNRRGTPVSANGLATGQPWKLSIRSIDEWVFIECRHSKVTSILITWQWTPNKPLSKVSCSTSFLRLPKLHVWATTSSYSLIKGVAETIFPRLDSSSSVRGLLIWEKKRNS